MSSRPDMGSATEIEQTLFQIKRARVRACNPRRPRSSALELSEHAAAIERQRRHLAELVRDFRHFLADAHADLNRGC
jgi:hypothetical protein